MFITRAVEEEILRGGSKYAQLYQVPAQAWLTVVDVLRDHEAFLPCDGSTFLEWARAEGLLE
jgi:hypothetical protein